MSYFKGSRFFFTSLIYERTLENSSPQAQSTHWSTGRLSLHALFEQSCYSRLKAGFRGQLSRYTILFMVLLIEWNMIFSAPFGRVPRLRCRLTFLSDHGFHPRGNTVLVAKD